MKSEAEEVSGAKRCKAALSSDLCSRLVTEFVGTFFLCFVCTTNSGELAGISAGAALMAVTFAGGHISGAHYNPAVTLAVVVRGAIEYTDALLYWIAQIAGAFLAGGFGYYLTANVVDDDDNYGSFVYPTLGDGTSLGQAYLAEILMTFALAYTVLNVATTKVQADNSYFAIAIGFTLLSGVLSVGGISGGAFNPAVGLLPIIVGETRHMTVYILAPLCGGLLSGLAFRFIMPTELPEGTFLASLGRNDSTGLAQLSRKCLVEFIGTFYLCFTVACSGASSNASSYLAPIAVGGILIGQVFAGGAVSGALYNPAITFGLYVRSFNASFSPACELLRAQLTAANVAAYSAVQFLGALCGGGMARVVYGDDALHNYAATIGYPFPGTLQGHNGKVVVGELLATFMLMYVVLHVATHSHNSGNSFFGLAVGFCVMAMAIAMGPKTGACMNPAVGLLSVAAGGNSRVVWVYFVGPLLGAFLAAVFFRFQCFSGDSPDGRNPKARNRFMFHAIKGKVSGAFHAYFIAVQEFSRRSSLGVRPTNYGMQRETGLEMRMSMDPRMSMNPLPGAARKDGP